MTDTRRRGLLKWVGLMVLAPGCVDLNPADHPPVPSAKINISFNVRDGVQVAELRVVDVNGTIEPRQVRVRIGDEIAYAEGGFRGEYTYSEMFGNEWGDGVQENDTLWLSTGDQLPSDRRLVVEVTSDEYNEWVSMLDTETP